MPSPIDRLFERLAATYGAAWARQWADVPVAQVKAAWATELAWWLASKERLPAIAWALSSLPERCPNAVEFRNLCRQAHAPIQPRLPEPAADPARVVAELAKLRDLSHVAQRDPRDWAHRIVERSERGERLNPTTRRFAYEALCLPQPASAKKRANAPAPQSEQHETADATA